MAVDMYIKLDDIKGESKDAGHTNEIDVLSWSWGVAQGGSAQTGGGSGTGKASVSDISFTKPVDKSTPLLFQMCCAGTAITKALLTVRKAGDKPLEYLKITMNQGIISSVHVGADRGHDVLTETITLNFASFTYEYTPQKPDGSGDASVVKGYDIAGNKKV